MRAPCTSFEEFAGREGIVPLSSGALKARARAASYKMEYAEFRGAAYYNDRFGMMGFPFLMTRVWGLLMAVVVTCFVFIFNLQEAELPKKIISRSEKSHPNMCLMSRTDFMPGLGSYMSGIRLKFFNFTMEFDVYRLSACDSRCRSLRACGKFIDISHILTVSVYKIILNEL